MNQLIDTIRKNRKFFLSILCVFLFSFIQNSLTPYTTDDFTYMYSFADNTRMTSPLQLFSSMWAHYNTINGRTAAHFFVQLMLIFPKWFFNLINSCIYTGFVYLIYKLTSQKKEFSSLVFFAIPICLWVHTPAYGEVYLWLTGSINYYWAYFFGLIFMCFYIKLYRTNEIHSRNRFIAFCIFSLFYGGYSENTSFPVIFISFILLVLTMYRTKKIKDYAHYVIPVICGAIGYLTILFSPAQALKGAEVSLSMYVHNFINLLIDYYTRHRSIIGILAVLFVIGHYAKADKKELTLAFSYFIISLLSVAMLFVASYLADRSLGTGAVFLIIAMIQLLQTLRTDSKFDLIAYGYSAYLIAGCLLTLWHGSYDIYNVYRQNHERESYIEAQLEAGETTVTVPIIYPATKYSCKYALTDLRTDDSDPWPNSHIAKYYGLKKIYGSTP